MEPAMHQGNQTIPPAVTQNKPIAGVQTYSFPLSSEARAELSLRGNITADDLEMLRDHIELTIKALKRAKEKADA